MWIVTDGGSTDGTLDIIRGVAPGEFRFSLNGEENQGIYHTMNKGGAAGLWRVCFF